MAEKTLSNLQRYLADEDYKKLLTLCLEPRQWNEISKQFTKQSKVFEMLKDLKSINALEFNGGKYITASFVADYLK